LAVSERMKKARKLIEKGKRPADVARLTGLTSWAISMDKECRRIRSERAPLVPKVELAFQKLIEADGEISVYRACKEVGLSPAALHRYGPYKQYVQEKKDAKQAENFV